MAGFQEDELINILVLGSSNTRISYFVKLFGAYLKYDTYKELTIYEPNLVSPVENVKETASNITTIGKHNFRLIDTPGLQKSSINYKEICDILLHFKTGSRLHAIILLIEPDKTGSDNYFEQYATHFFSGLKEFTDNVLYVLYNDIYKYNQTYMKLGKVMDGITMDVQVPKSNVFHLQVNAFYGASESNWGESVSFCKNVFEYIRGLNSFYIECVVPQEEAFVNLIYRLLEILIEIYYWSEFYNIRNRTYYISHSEYETVCYGNNCVSWKQFVVVGTRLKVPQVCHKDCNCSQLKEKCLVFQPSKTHCSECNCDITEHQKYVFKKEYISGTKNIHDEKIIVLSILTQFYIFLKKKVSVSINEFFSKEIEGYAWFEEIKNTFKVNFEEELKLFSKIDITREKLIVCISKLYEIKEITGLLPALINENFPEGFRLEIVAKPQKENNTGNTELKLLTSENQSMKRKLEQLKLQLLEFDFTQNNLTAQESQIQYSDKLNIEAIDEATSNSNYKVPVKHMRLDERGSPK